ncbi:MAG: hypothetical protein NZM05_11835, partial [Chloroherpetonaceae bacterium]|nr:hypothetical protein [Chloroherpetonaceae bacterium]
NFNQTMKKKIVLGFFALLCALVTSFFLEPPQSSAESLGERTYARILCDQDGIVCVGHGGFRCCVPTGQE